MTKAEKIIISIAVISLVISISTPIATYIWLDPKIREFSNRAKLEIYGGFTKFETFAYMGNMKFVDRESLYTLTLTNTGRLPAKDIQIVVQYKENPPNGEFFTFNPPSQYEVRYVGSQIFITIKRPLPSQDSLNITFKQIPNLLTVSTETGESNVLNPSYGAIMPETFKPIDISEAPGNIKLSELPKNHRRSTAR
jgi:hypothetical protein